MPSKFLTMFLIACLFTVTSFMFMNFDSISSTQIKSGFFNFIFTPTIPIASETFSVATRETGMKWPILEPSNNNYDWSYLDSKILAAQKGNIEQYIVLLPGRRSPLGNWPPVTFCTVSESCPLQNSDEARAEWQEFLEKVFERYDYDGDPNDMPGLSKAFKNWQIGNEFETHPQFGGTKEEYVILLKEAWDAKNASNPEPTIILGGLLFPEKLGRCYSNSSSPDCSDPTVIYQKYVLENAKNGSNYYYDFIDLHFFNWFIYKPNLIKEAVTGLKLTPSGKPLLSLEWTAAFGLFDLSGADLNLWQAAINRPLNGDCNHDGEQDPNCKEGNPTYDTAQTVFEKYQGEDIVRVFTTLIGQGLDKIGLIYVQFSDWHKLWCFSPAWNYQGLVRMAIPPNVCNDDYTGSNTVIAKKPAWYNYQKLMQYLDNYESVVEISPCSGAKCYGYKFIIGGETRIIIWPALGSSVPADLSSHFNSPQVCYKNFVTNLDNNLDPIFPNPIVYPKNAVNLSATPAIVTKKQPFQTCPPL